MKNNLILGVQGLKKMLKSIFLVVGLFMVVVVDAKPTGVARPSSDEPVQRRDTRSTGTGTSSASTTTSRASNTAARTSTVTGQTSTRTRQPQVTTTIQQKAMPANLSNLGQAGWIDYTTSEKLDKFLQKNSNRLTPNDIKVLEARLDELRDAENVSSKDQLIISLQRQLARQEALLEKFMAGSAAFDRGRMVSPVAQTEGWSATLKGYAMMPFAGTAYVLNGLYEWATARDMTRPEKVAYLAEYWMQQLQDQGKYPTYKSRTMAINEDVINTGQDVGVTDDMYVDIRAELQKRLNAQSAQYFRDKPGEKANEKLIDDEINDVRSVYNRDEDDLEGYLNDLRAANMNKVGINRCRAMVSEFLRTDDVLKLKKDAANIAAGQQQSVQVPAATTGQAKPAEQSWWDRITSMKFGG